MDGALTIGSPAAAHINWRTPQQVDARRLENQIEHMTRRLNFTDGRALKRMADEVDVTSTFFEK